MKHTISVLVEDKPGALARISTMFARRGFNIESLAVGPTERPGVSCITLRVDCAQHTLEQIEKQIHKLVNVLRVTELTPGEAVERELLLIKASRDARAARGADRDRRGVRRRGDRPRARRGRVRADGDTRGARRVPRAVPPARRPGARPHRPGSGLARASAKTRRPPHELLGSINSTKGHTRMATILRDGDLSLLDGKVAVIGYGSQGHAHALNLRDSGVQVEVGLREGSASWEAAEAAGLAVKDFGDAVKGARLVSMLLPDQVQPSGLHRARRPRTSTRAPRCCSRTASTSSTAASRPGESNDVIMVAPKGPGHVVRRLFTEGYGTPALIAVEHDATGQRARPRARVRASGSAPVAPGSSRRRSRRRPRPTSSASRPSSAAARPSSSAPGSRRSSRPATHPRSRTTSASTS